MMRKPLALSNWKMAMTVSESLAFVGDFEAIFEDLLDEVDVVICPPCTALWPVAQALRGTRIQLGGQNIAPTADPARTGEISATLLADVGCRWVMLGQGAIGVRAPASPEHVAAGGVIIRGWLRGRWGDVVAEVLGQHRWHIIYGGSVAPEYAADLLACPDVDGLGATRRGRDPATFAQIVRLIAQVRD
jgi:triosephosphate isomerase